MFIPGTAIQVLYSTCNKIGPRRGSIGIVRKCSDNVLHEKAVDMTVIHAAVNFIRYGFEKTHRNEYKDVLLVIPDLSRFMKNKRDMAATVKELNNINFGIGKYKAIRANWCYNYGLPDNKNTNIVFAVPLVSDLDLSNKYIAEAWLNTIILKGFDHDQNVLLNMFENEGMTEMFTRNLHPDIAQVVKEVVKTLHLCLHDKRGKIGVINKISKDENYRTAFLFGIRYIESVLFIRKYKKYRDSIVSFLQTNMVYTSSKKNQLRFNTIYQTLMSIFFVGNSLDMVVKEILEKDKTSTLLNNYLKNVVDYKNKLVLTTASPTTTFVSKKKSPERNVDA